MRAVSRLPTLQSVLRRRCARLEVLAQRVAHESNAACGSHVAYLAIESLTTWSNFIRSYFLSCTVLRARLGSGARVTHMDPSIVDERSALLKAISIVRQETLADAQNGQSVHPRFEPIWHEKRTLERLSDELRFSNDPEVLAALSHQTTFFAHLPPIRNFFAHRSRRAANTVAAIATQGYGLVGLSHPVDLVNKRFSGRPTTLMVEWLMDMRSIGDELCS